MSENRLLRETFANPESRCDCTVATIDIAGSTAWKEQQPQATWLSSLGFFYDNATAIAVESAPDVVVKYLGDGIMFVFDADHTTEAVNAVIRIQEVVNEQSKGSGGAKGAIDFACSAGISTGEVVRFVTPGGHVDFVGTVVDKAFRLCAAASAKAIFVDTPTLGAANMIRISSTFGRAIGRTSDQYQGDVQRAVLKGFDQPVNYHEILWDQQLYGVKSSTVTASTDRLRVVASSAAPRSSEASAGGPPRGMERHRGDITTWRPDRDFGFVRDPISGEDFHFTRRHLVYSDDVAKLSPGREVAFVAVGSLDGSKRRQAGAVLVSGEPADGPLVSQPVGKPYGWVRVEDDHGNRHLVYVPAAELQGHRVGEILGFTVEVNDRGAYARAIEQVQDDEDNAA